MKKYTLIKFFNGEASPQEVDEIVEWVNKSQLNSRYFAKLKSLHTISGLVKELPVNKTKKTPQRIKLLLYAAGISAISFIIGLSLNNIDHTANETSSPIVDVLKNSNTNTIRTLYTEKGVKAYITLPDNSKVWLNSDTKITYPDKFIGKTRNINICGEAYFQVAKDSLHPMIITTNRNFSIKVLGTSFNIRSYANDSKAETTLYSGSIQMVCKNDKNAKEEVFQLKPNESFIVYDKSPTPVHANKMEPQKEIAWTKGELIFEDTVMEDVIKMLERWHGTKFIVNNKEIYNYKLTASFGPESIVQILDMIQLIIPIKCQYNNNIVSFN